MSNIAITNNDLSSVTLKDLQFRDAFITFTAASTLVAGTILALDSVSKKYVPFVVGGTTNNNGIPKSLIVKEIIAEAAGDIPCRIAVSGSVKKELLVIDGNNPGVGIDEDVITGLRDFTLIPIDVKELNIYDNQ